MSDDHIVDVTDMCKRCRFINAFGGLPNPKDPEECVVITKYHAEEREVSQSREKKFPTIDEEVAAFIADLNNKLTNEQMLKYYESAYPKLIIRCSDAEQENTALKEQLDQERQKVAVAKSLVVEGLDLYIDNYPEKAEAKFKSALTALDSEQEGVWLREDDQEAF